MKTFELYTIGGQKVTVRNCDNLEEAFTKAELTEDVVFKTIEL